MYRSVTVFLPILILFYSNPLHARNLRVATVTIDPFYTQTRDGYVGYVPDLMDNLMERANMGTGERMQYRFQLAPDNSFGVPDQNGRWNGLMGEVIEGRADMAVAPITITRARSQVVHFSHPFMSPTIVPLVKKPNPGAHLPFTNLTDLHAKQQNRELVVGFVQHGSTELFLSDHKLPLIRSIYNTSKAANIDSPYVDNYEAGVAKVRNSGGKFVFFGEQSAFEKAMQTEPCDLAIAWPGQIGARNYGFIFPSTEEGFDLLKKFNYVLIAAEEDGTLAALYYRWWDQKATCKRPEMCVCHDEATPH